MVGGHGERAEVILGHTGHLYISVLPRHPEAEDGLVAVQEGLQPLGLCPGAVDDEAELRPGVAALRGAREPEENIHQLVTTFRDHYLTG